MFKLPVKFKLLNHAAKVPSKKRAGDAGYDVTAIKGGWIWPKCRRTFRTGLKLQFDKSYACIAKSRSGLATRKSIDVKAGVIDSVYTGEYMICLANSGWLPYRVRKGDKIAQLLFVPVEQVEFTNEAILPTDRGADGFGSTGR